MEGERLKWKQFFRLNLKFWEGLGGANFWGNRNLNTEKQTKNQILVFERPKASYFLPVSTTHPKPIGFSPPLISHLQLIILLHSIGGRYLYFLLLPLIPSFFSSDAHFCELLHFYFLMFSKSFLIILLCLSILLWFFRTRDEGVPRELIAQHLGIPLDKLMSRPNLSPLPSYVS